MLSSMLLLFYLALAVLCVTIRGLRLPSPPRAFGALVLTVSLQCGALQAACAVSGGGKDYATKDLKGQSFVGVDARGKDFTQVDAKGVQFNDAKLQGARFYRAFLESASFDGADLSGASLEDAGLSKATFKNAILANSYLGSGFELVSTIEGADFTDALMPTKVSSLLCLRQDISTANPKTGVITSESLLCP
jgi:uncharacterized protein YjbI with pentapeptide repeats